MHAAFAFYRSPVFRKLLFSALLVIAVTLLVSDFFLTRYTADRQRQMVEWQLAAQARILAGEVVRVPANGLEAWARDAGSRSQARITVIEASGAVGADSQHDPETMENHGGRPEVVQARQSGMGVAIRHSATLDVDLCYLAWRLSGPPPGSVLRLAVPLREIDAAVAEVRWRIFKGSLLAGAIALVLAFFFSRSFSRRVRTLQGFAEGMLSANPSVALAPEADDELGALAKSLTRMSAKLRELIETLSLESRRRESILASMVEGVLAVDGEMRVIFCNAAFARAVGVTGTVPERLPLLELVRDPELIDLFAAVLVKGEPEKRVLRLAAAGGRSFEVHASSLASGSKRGAIAALHDITDLERLERVRKDFVANVSHELRTPLTAIRGYAETLLDGALEDRENSRHFVEVILSHANRLNNIASDLLVLSELETERKEPDQRPVSVGEALQSAMATVESEARLRQVPLKRGHMEDVCVMGNRLRLEQVLVNLLDNAIKFNREGGDVRVEVERTPEGKARITVADTGPGIASEHLPRIFERFYRADTSRSRALGGTGLGLSIVKHAIERMNGTITAESRLGEGSTFTILLPAV